jgi:MSHA biogenesis protein MshK
VAVLIPLSEKLPGVFLLLFMLVAGVCQAVESLPDPTRPPASLGPSPGYGEELEQAPPPLPVLQSVILSASRKVAVIGGQAVRLGEKFGDAKLIRLTPEEAVLRTAEGEVQVLKLFPDIGKKMTVVQQDGKMSNMPKRRSAPEKNSQK